MPAARGSGSGWAVIAGASLPLTHSVFPVGCDGSGFSVNVPSVTVARAPQRDTHNGQYVATSVEVGVLAMTSYPRSACPAGRSAYSRSRPRRRRAHHALPASIAWPRR